jgi:hypothetical protein
MLSVDASLVLGMPGSPWAVAASDCLKVSEEAGTCTLCTSVCPLLHLWNRPRANTRRDCSEPHLGRNDACLRPRSLEGRT